jgi:AcrR family transcriptional regulator
MKQIREFRPLICEAFLRLLQTESLEEITIFQIAAEAAIGRNRFDNHFQSKAGILLYLMESWREEIQERIQSTKANT